MNEFLKICKKNCIYNYYKFSGRIPRKDFFISISAIFLVVVFFPLLLSLLVLIFQEGVNFTWNIPTYHKFSELWEVIMIVFVLITFLPSFALISRRLHDIEYPGVLCLVSLSPLFILWFFLFLKLCKKGTKGENKYGNDPYSEKANIKVITNNYKKYFFKSFTFLLFILSLYFDSIYLGLVPSKTIYDYSDVDNIYNQQLIKNKIIKQEDEILLIYDTKNNFSDYSFNRKFKEGSILTKENLILYKLNDEKLLFTERISLKKVIDIDLEKKGNFFKYNYFRVYDTERNLYRFKLPHNKAGWRFFYNLDKKTKGNKF